MLNPLAATGLARILLPGITGVLSKVGSLFGGLIGGADDPPAKDVDYPGDDSLLSQMLLKDPAMRETLRREVDRRLSDDLPEDLETTVRLRRLRDLLERIEAQAAEEEAKARESAQAASGPTASAESPTESQPLASLDAPSNAPGIEVPAAPVAGNPPGIAVAPSMVADHAIAAAPAGTSVGPGAFRVPLPAPGEADLIDRVLRAAKLTQSRGVARLRLVLTPPELGELRLDLSMRQKTLHATIQADRASAAEAILAQVSALKEALERQGFEIGEFTVTSDAAFAQADGGAGREFEPGEVDAPDRPETEEIVRVAVPASGPGPQILDVKA